MIFGEEFVERIDAIKEDLGDHKGLRVCGA